MQVNSLRDTNWISCSTSRWQDYCDAATRRGPVPAIGPKKVKGSTSLKNSMNQKMRNMNAILGRV
jgi:hypothetical protein